METFAGKTYTLTPGYRRAVADLADRLLARVPDPIFWLDLIRKTGGRKRLLTKLSCASPPRDHRSYLLASARDKFSPYTQETASHLASLPFRRRFDRILSTTEEQLWLHMLEVEFVNRAGREAFARCEERIAFLPWCLHDLSRECRASSDGFDYVCRACSAQCLVARASRLLEEKGIRTYLWMEADLKKLLRTRRRAGGRSLGILGIACLPELVRGMRLCRRCHVPVVGVPLDANRCARWMGEFHPTSADEEALEDLLK